MPGWGGGYRRGVFPPAWKQKLILVKYRGSYKWHAHHSRRNSGLLKNKTKNNNKHYRPINLIMHDKLAYTTHCSPGWIEWQLGESVSGDCCKVEGFSVRDRTAQRTTDTAMFISSPVERIKANKLVKRKRASFVRSEAPARQVMVQNRDQSMHDKSYFILLCYFDFSTSGQCQFPSGISMCIRHAVWNQTQFTITKKNHFTITKNISPSSSPLQ